MKKLSLLFCICAFATMAFAQLPNLSYAPAFTGYEINKTDGTINTTTPIVLHDWTDAGYPVFIDVFATWCGPCWSYHTAGNFENLYSQYGPNGTNEVRVIGIEGSYGNYASLSGTGPDSYGQSTQGNWLNGVEYPIIPLRMSPNTTAFDNNYSIAYYPTIYMVSPNRLVFEVGQKSTANLYAAINNLTPVGFNNNLANNALAVEVNGFNPPYYCGATINPTFRLQNLGNDPLTSANIILNFDGQTSTFNWTGNLNKWQIETVTLPQISTNDGGQHSYSVTVDQVNGVADSDPVWNTKSATFNVQVTPSPAPINEDFNNGIPSTWDVANGLLRAYGLSTAHGGAILFNAYSYDSGTIDELYLPYADLSNFQSPVLKFDVAYRQYSTSYSERLRVLYSTDCGQTWTSIYTKSGQTLATVSSTTTSSYMPTESHWRTEMVDLSSISNKEAVILKFEFRSGYGNNVWIDNVFVGDGTGIVENESEFKLYPNPAQNVLNIATEEMIESVEIYNLQGQLVQVENGNVNSINVSNLATGNYFVRIQTANNTITRKFTKE
ncbi:MAG: T9SS type A sorting domain-containing protein [Bacteroidales bacterium]|nr:T9SS type A sorting domain-containing protein [Bacteroidales bacterium]